MKLTKINRWGNSLALHIPAWCAKKLNLAPSSPVDIEYRDGAIYVTPIKPTPPPGGSNG